jgi:outer membrane protein assembly factor BamB
VFSSPAVANGVVYVGSVDGNVYALNASTGAKLWSFNAGDVVASSPAVANGVVYIGSFDNKVYAFDQTGGALVRRTAQRPNPSMLLPNLSLKVSEPVVTLSTSSND